MGHDRPNSHRPSRRAAPRRTGDHVTVRRGLTSGDPWAVCRRGRSAGRPRQDSGEACKQTDGVAGGPWMAPVSAGCRCRGVPQARSKWRSSARGAGRRRHVSPGPPKDSAPSQRAGHGGRRSGTAATSADCRAVFTGLSARRGETHELAAPEMRFRSNMAGSAE